MMTSSLASLKDLIHAQLCYQLFITPLPLPLEKKYRDFAQMACEFIEDKRSEVLHQNFPRHHVIHRFKPTRPEAKKILITHGWQSRAAYMVRLISALHKEGYDVYAIDFPAHGESKGLWFVCAILLYKNLTFLFYASMVKTTLQFPPKNRLIFVMNIEMRPSVF